MDEKKIEEVFRRIDGWGGEMVDFLTMLVSLPAIGPASGGTGESKKVDAIKDWLTRTGFTDQRSFDAPDGRVPSGIRPNLTVWLRGRESRRRLLIITHTDVVPPGNLDQWDSDPFKAVEKDGKLYGRGTEDNGQSITSSLFAARALMELELVPVFDVGLVLVADEENDNEKGIAHLLAQDLFREGDLIVVADHGEPDGMLIEVSEKSLAWVKVTTRGKQCHSSLPDLGKNAFRAAMDFWHLAEHTLGERFPMKERTFDHPISTFEPTKKEVNVENVNTIPGEDVFYMDCRLLPPYTNDELMAELRAVADEVQQEHGVTIDIEFILREDAPPPTDPGSEVVLRLGRVVEQVRGKRPRIGGIGGSTTAASMRRAGFPAVAWETVLNTAHSHNEHILVDNMVEDCKVFAALYLQGDLSP